MKLIVWLLLVPALVFGILGYAGFIASFTSLAIILFWIFIVLFVLGMVARSLHLI